jgi:uncharacterized protein
MYLKQIEQLVVLQKVDDEIVILERELETAPREIAELEAGVTEVEDEKAAMDDKISYLEGQRKRLESEIDTDSTKLKKSKNKLMMVANAKEYHAMMREMDNMEKQNRAREEERTAVDEELARVTEAKTQVLEKLDGIVTELTKDKANLEGRLKSAKSRLKELGVQRSTACEAVPKPILQRYEFIRERLSNPVIVAVDAGICSGCHISIPPQAFIELQKGQQILSCPNCQRLIFWTNHVPGAAPEAAAAEEAEAAAS